MARTIPRASDERRADEFWKLEKPLAMENEERDAHPCVADLDKSDGQDNPQPALWTGSPSTEGKVSRPGDGLATPRDIQIALTYGLELARCGAMLVASEGHLQLANRAALAILEKKDGLWFAQNGLVADRASDTRLLQQLLRDAARTPEFGEPKGSPITLPRKKARSALIVRIVPGPGLDCWPDTENRAALLTLYDEDKGVEVDEAVLCKLYGLTRGEAALAAILLQGKSIDEAASQLFISPHTARTHLKRIFMKTDTHRQTELVVRMFSSIL